MQSEAERRMRLKVLLGVRILLRPPDSPALFRVWRHTAKFPHSGAKWATVVPLEKLPTVGRVLVGDHFLRLARASSGFAEGLSAASRDEFHIEHDLYVLTDQYSAGFESSIPGQPKILAVDLRRRR